MAFIVKATGRAGFVCWLSAANEAGFRPLAPRTMADVFLTVQDAHDAIALLPRAFEHVGGPSRSNRPTDRAVRRYNGGMITRQHTSRGWFVWIVVLVAIALATLALYAISTPALTR
jgi:hypothetical protein